MKKFKQVKTQRYIYEKSVSSGTVNKISELYFTSTPIGVCYNYNGEDVIMFSTNESGLYIYNGDSVTVAENSPGVTSMCIHSERLFITDGLVNNSLWFSDDFDPENWNISLSEAGFIDMSGLRGRLLKVISFGGYLYVFRTYGITRVTAFGEQSDFSVSDLYVASGRIFGDSITVCGDCILFLASDGLYRFDGLSTTRISDPYIEYIDFNYEDVKGVYFNGRAYFLLKVFFEGASEVCLLRIDPKDYSDYYFICGMHFSDIEVIGGENVYKLCAISQSGMAYELTDEGVMQNTPTTKVWLGKFGDFGVKRRKLLEKITLYSDTDIVVTVTADDRKQNFAVSGKVYESEIRPLIAGNRFSVKITASKLNAKIVGMMLTLRYYDE